MIDLSKATVETWDTPAWKICAQIIFLNNKILCNAWDKSQIKGNTMAIAC